MMQRVDELTSEPVVGRYYLVPCAVDVPYARAHPVMGPKHADIEFFNFRVEHYHNDVRFMSVSMLHKICNEEFWRYEEDWAAAVVLTQVFNPQGYAMGYRKMKCVRRMPDFPDMTRDKNAVALQNAFVGKTVTCGRCPHRGTDLRSMPTENGVTVCPSHGLCIEVRTQRIITRVAAEQIVTGASQ